MPSHLTLATQIRSHRQGVAAYVLQNLMSAEEEQLSTLQLDPFGKVPGMCFEQRADGRIFFRYVVDDVAQYPGFDGQWREMSEAEIRESLRMGGRVAEWLRGVASTESDS